MQSVSTEFVNHAHGQVRPLSWQVRASFDKSFDPSVGFFTLDQSLLDGADVLAPDDTDTVISEWDKYAYSDITRRVISIEVTREEIEPYSIVQAYADVTLNNYDNYFTPNSGSPIDQFILPKRPFRILAGFNGENVPLFVGLSEKIPEIDKQSRVAKFHLIDFLTFIFEKEVGQSVMLQDASTGDILDYLFQLVGLLPGQYVLDDTSFNRINFFYVEKGTKLGTVVRDLMQAEQGRLYMDELGIIRFLNRQNYNTTPVWNFDKSNTINYEVSTEDDVINYVKLTSNILDEREEQSVWQLAEPVYINSGETLDVWANLIDPVTAITTPTYSAIQTEASHFITTSDELGEVPYTNVTLSDIDVFAKAVRLEFTNSGGTGAYIYAVDLWGTPVRIVDRIIVESYDQVSIDTLEERRYEFETNYIQDRDDAVSKAEIMVDDYKDYGSIVDTDVKGNFALQIGDVINQELDGYSGNYSITKITNILSNGRYEQRLRSKFKEPRLYFILSSDSEAKSLLDSEDVLSP